MPDRALLRAVAAGLVAAALVAVVPRLSPGAELLAYLGVLALLGIALAVLVGRRLATPRRHRHPSAPARAGMRLPPLTRLARLCDAAARNADDADRRLRPRLIRIAEDALTAHSVDLRHPGEAERARQLLGDEAYAWLRPRHPGNEQPGHAPAADQAALERVVAALERLEAAPR